MIFSPQNSQSTCAPTLLGEPQGEMVFRIARTRHDNQEVRIESAKCTVGSGADCTLSLRSPFVQRVHCLIVQGDRGCIVRRFASDTRLNGRVFQDAWLMPGDRLSIGPVDLDFIGWVDGEDDEYADFDDDLACRESESEPIIESGETVDSEALLQKDEMIEGLENTLAQLQSHVDFRKEQQESSRNRCRALLGQIRNERQEVERFESEWESQNAKVLGLEKQLEDAQQKLAEQGESHDMDQLILGEQRQQIEDLQRELAEQEDEAEKQKQSLEKISESLSQASRGNQEAEEKIQQLATLDEELSGLKESKACLQKTLEKKEEYIDKIHAHLKDALSRESLLVSPEIVEHQEQLLDESKNELNQANERLADTQQKSDELRSLLSTTQEELQEKDAAIDLKVAENEELLNAASETKARLVALQSEQEEWSEHQDDVASYRTQIDELTESEASMREQLATKREEIETLVAAIEEMEKEWTKNVPDAISAEQEEQIAEAQDRLFQQEKELQDMKQTLVETAEEMRAFQLEREQWQVQRERLVELEEESHAWEERETELQKSLDLKQQNLDEVQQELENTIQEQSLWETPEINDSKDDGNLAIEDGLSQAIAEQTTAEQTTAEQTTVEQTTVEPSEALGESLSVDHESESQMENRAFAGNVQNQDQKDCVELDSIVDVSDNELAGAPIESPEIATAHPSDALSSLYEDAIGSRLDETSTEAVAEPNEPSEVPSEIVLQESVDTVSEEVGFDESPNQLEIGSELKEELTVYEDTALEKPQDPDATSMEANDEEDSIEDYMERLLGRLKGSGTEHPSNADAAPNSNDEITATSGDGQSEDEVEGNSSLGGVSASDKNSSETPGTDIQKQGHQPQSLQGIDMDSMNSEELFEHFKNESGVALDELEQGDYTPTREAPEKNSNLKAMRELANESARSAIATSKVKKKSNDSILFYCVGGVLFVGGLGLMTLATKVTDVYMISALGSVAGSGALAFKGYLMSLSQKAK